MLGFIIFILVVVIVILIVLSYMTRREAYTSSSVANIGTLGDFRVHPPETINNFVGKDNMNEYGSYYNPFFPYVAGMREPYVNETANSPSADTRPSMNEIQTINRLDRIDQNLLPKVSENVTPYNIDVADPVTYTYQVHAPRVIRKDRLAMEADPIRGDIPISIYPDVPIVQRSQFNRDSLRLDGTFSEALAKTYDRLSGKTYFNQPIHLSHGAMLM